MKNVASRFVFTILITLLFSTSVHSQQVWGTVQIQNRHPFAVDVLVQRYNQVGVLVWVPIYRVVPNGFANIPGIPSGTYIGLQGVGNNRNWTPFPVYYPNPYNPFFIYVIP